MKSAVPIAGECLSNWPNECKSFLLDGGRLFALRPISRVFRELVRGTPATNVGRRSFSAASQTVFRYKFELSARRSDLTHSPANGATFGNDGARLHRGSGNRSLRRPAGKKGTHHDGKQHRQPEQDARPGDEAIERAIAPIGGELMKRQHRETEPYGEISQA